MTQTGIETATFPWEAQEVDRWLREGKPTIGWRGDPRLELRMGYSVAADNGVYHGKYKRRGDVVGVRWEVWRACEDGKDRRILAAPAEGLTDIIPRLIGVDPRTPGHEDVMDRVEREDAQVQKEKANAIREAHGEHMDHLWRLVHDRQNGPNTFRGMPGSNPDRQM